MKKRVISLLLVCLLCFGFCRVQAQTEAYVQILKGTVENQTLTLTVRVGQTETLTLLIYKADEQGNQGDLLYATQWDAPSMEILTKSFSVAPSSQGYVVRVGGSNVDLPKTIILQEKYVSSTVRMEGEETTHTLTQKATYLQNVTITRGEDTVTPGDVVLPGDQVDGIWGENPYTGYAVIGGDVDLNGAVNAKDALLVLRCSVGKATLSQAAFAAADFEQSGKINAVVALNILKYSVGKLKSL